MRRCFRRLMSYSVYRKTLYFYTVSMIASILVILVSLFGIMMSSIKDQAIASSGKILSQIVYASTKTKGEIDNLMSLIYTNSRALKFVSNEKSNKIDEYNLYTYLRDLKSCNMKVKNISLVNLKNNTYVQCGGDNDSRAENINLASTDERLGSYVVPRSITLNGKTENVVTFIQNLPYSNFFAIVDVDLSAFDCNISSQDSQRELYIISQDGKPVSNNSRNKIGDMQVSEYLFQFIPQAQGDSFWVDDAQNRKIIFFSRAENLDWWFCDIQDISHFSDAYSGISLIFGSVALVLLMFCAVISFFFNKNLQKPLAALASKCRQAFGNIGIESGDDITFIDNAIKKVEHEKYINDNYMKVRFLNSLILGEEIDSYIPNEKIESMTKEYYGEYYTVLLLRAQSKDEISEENVGKEYGILRYTVCNLAQEIFSESFQCVCVDIGGKEVACLILSDTPELSDEYLLPYEKLKDFCLKNINATITGSIGITVDALAQINNSYKSAVEYLEMGSLVGRDDLIDSSVVANIRFRDKNVKLVSQIKEYTAVNFSNPELSLKNMSAKFGLSATYLGRIFKTVEGTSYAAYLSDYRLAQAEILLAETNKTIVEIADCLGFTNSTYFSTQFKNAYGITPSAFRKNL